MQSLPNMRAKQIEETIQSLSIKDLQEFQITAADEKAAMTFPPHYSEFQSLLKARVQKLTDDEKLQLPPHLFVFLDISRPPPKAKPGERPRAASLDSKRRMALNDLQRDIREEYNFKMRRNIGVDLGNNRGYRISDHFKIADIQDLLAHMPKEDLHKIDWSGADFDGVDVSKLDLRSLNLTGANFKGAKFDGAILDGVDFKGTSLGGVDLNGADFKGAYLGKANLVGADFKGAKMTGVNLYNADFKTAKLGGATWTGVDFKGAKLGYADMKDADFKNTKWDDADLNFTNFEGTKLGGADLKGAVFGATTSLTGADLKGAEFRGAYVLYANGADFNGANLGGIKWNNRNTNWEGAKLAGANLDGADLREAHGADFRNANLKGADISGVRFHMRDFSGTKFAGVKAQGAHFQSGTFTGADMNGFDMAGVTFAGSMEGADLKGAKLKGVIWDNTRFKTVKFGGADLDGVDFEGCTFEGADLNGADFKGAKLGKARLDGANFSGAGLGGSDLTEADLTMPGTYNRKTASFSGADTDGLILKRAKMSDTTQEDVYFTNTDMTEVFADGTTFKNVTIEKKTKLDGLNTGRPDKTKPPKTQFYTVRITDASIKNADLRESTFTESLIDTTHFDGTDLRKSTFSGGGIVKSSLIDAKLGNSTFAPGYILVGNTLTRANFDNATMAGVDLTGSTVNEASFKKAKLMQAVLSKIKGEKADFSEADLTLANLTEAELNQANFDRAKLVQAVLHKMKGDKVSFAGADMQRANLVLAVLTNSNFTGADLQKANLAEATLTNGTFTNANLQGAFLFKTNLSGSDLRGAKLQGSVLQGADLRNIKFDADKVGIDSQLYGAIYDDTTQLPGLDNANPAAREAFAKKYGLIHVDKIQNVSQTVKLADGFSRQQALFWTILKGYKFTDQAGNVLADAEIKNGKIVGKDGKPIAGAKLAGRVLDAGGEEVEGARVVNGELLGSDGRKLMFGNLVGKVVDAKGEEIIGARVENGNIVDAYGVKRTDAQLLGRLYTGDGSEYEYDRIENGEIISKSYQVSSPAQNGGQRWVGRKIDDIKNLKGSPAGSDAVKEKFRQIHNHLNTLQTLANNPPTPENQKLYEARLKEFVGAEAFELYELNKKAGEGDADAKAKLEAKGKEIAELLKKAQAGDKDAANRLKALSGKAIGELQDQITAFSKSQSEALGWVSMGLGLTAFLLCALVPAGIFVAPIAAAGVELGFDINQGRGDGFDYTDEQLFNKATSSIVAGYATLPLGIAGRGARIGTTYVVTRMGGKTVARMLTSKTGTVLTYAAANQTAHAATGASYAFVQKLTHSLLEGKSWEVALAEAKKAAPHGALMGLTLGNVIGARSHRRNFEKFKESQLKTTDAALAARAKPGVPNTPPVAGNPFANPNPGVVGPKPGENPVKPNEKPGTPPEPLPGTNRQRLIDPDINRRLSMNTVPAEKAKEMIEAELTQAGLPTGNVKVTYSPTATKPTTTYNPKTGEIKVELPVQVRSEGAVQRVKLQELAHEMHHIKDYQRLNQLKAEADRGVAGKQKEYDELLFTLKENERMAEAYNKAKLEVTNLEAKIENPNIKNGEKAKLEADLKDAKQKLNTAEENYWYDPKEIEARIAEHTFLKEFYLNKSNEKLLNTNPNGEPNSYQRALDLEMASKYHEQRMQIEMSTLNLMRKRQAGDLTDPDIQAYVREMEGLKVPPAEIIRVTNQARRPMEITEGNHMFANPNELVQIEVLTKTLDSAQKKAVMDVLNRPEYAEVRRQLRRNALTKEKCPAGLFTDKLAADIAKAMGMKYEGEIGVRGMPPVSYYSHPDYPGKFFLADQTAHKGLGWKRLNSQQLQTARQDGVSTKTGLAYREGTYSVDLGRRMSD